MSHAWDADEYDARFGFVTAYGAPLLRLLDARPGERVLDLGCGTGHQAAGLAAEGVEVVGLDLDPDMMRAARAAYGDVPGLSFVAADALAFTPADIGGQVDAVLSNAALHWMTDQPAVLGCTRRALRPGGRFVAEMGGVGNVARVRAALAAGVAETTGADADDVRRATEALSWFPTPAEQARLLENAGFVVRRLELIDRPTPLQGTVAQWCAHFRREVLEAAGDSPELRAAIDRHAEALGLRTADGWVADYVRLRFTSEAA